MLCHFQVLEDRFSGLFTDFIDLPCCQLSFGKLSSDIVEHAIGEARSGSGSMSNSTALSMLLHFSKRQRMQVALLDTMDPDVNANRSYRAPTQPQDRDKKALLEYFQLLILLLSQEKNL